MPHYVRDARELHRLLRYIGTLFILFIKLCTVYQDQLASDALKLHDDDDELGYSVIGHPF